MNCTKRRLQKLLGVSILALWAFSCSRPQDYILVIDTSGSMSLGERVIEKIKANIEDFTSDLELGETITLLGFDSNPRFYKTYKIQSDADRERPARKVRSLFARGAYTDMEAMLYSVSALSKKLKTPGRQLVLVVMSDGKDDPPPWKRSKNRKKLKLETLKKSNWFWGIWEEPYIYYVSLGKLQDDKLIEGLTQIAPRVQSIKDSKTAGLGEVSKDIEEELSLRSALAFLSGLFLLALLALGLRWFLRPHKLRGVLEYYDVDVGPSLKGSFRLTKLNAHKFSIGRKTGAQLKIRGFGSSENFVLKSTSFKKLPCLRPQKKYLEHIHFKRSRFESKSLISPGDQFEAGNYLFEYK